MWQADEDTENTATMISLLDIIMLFLLVRMLMGYAGGFRQAYKAFSSLEPQTFLAQAPLMCCWSKCQPPVTFNKGLMRWIKINLLTMLGLAFISSVIHIIVVHENSLFGKQDSSQECSSVCLGSMYTTKIMLISAVQQVLTVLRPLKHALGPVHPIRKLMAIKFGLFINTLQWALLSHFGSLVPSRTVNTCSC